jgi:hypothetical protein
MEGRGPNGDWLCTTELCSPPEAPTYILIEYGYGATGGTCIYDEFCGCD